MGPEALTRLAKGVGRSVNEKVVRVNITAKSRALPTTGSCPQSESEVSRLAIEFDVVVSLDLLVSPSVFVLLDNLLSHSCFDLPVSTRATSVSFEN